MSAVEDKTRPEIPLPGLLPDHEVSDGGPDPALDELVRLAAVLSGADYAYLAWIDATWLWFKSTYGFSAREQARQTSACNWVAAQGTPMLIRDVAAEALIDSRFQAEG